MVKRLIKMALALPDVISNKITFFRRKPVCKSSPQIKGRVYIVSDPGAISFGENVKINSSLSSNPIGGSTRTILFAEPNAKIQIGNNVGISNSAIHAAVSVVIEDDVMIGGDCRIYDTDFHSADYASRTCDIRTKTAPVVIKHGAFIGAHCIILKGVVIGERAVVGAGSVVTKSIPADDIWAGNPAKCIKKQAD